MKFDRSLWVPTLIAMIILYALNFHCWSPGIGGRTDVRPDGSRPAGSQLEIYLGFPACYRAELWRSDEPGLTMQLLASAPFVSAPESMTVVANYTSVLAALVNLLFAFAVLAILWMLVSEERHRWNGVAKIVAAGCAAVAVVCYLVGDRVSTHL